MPSSGSITSPLPERTNVRLCIGNDQQRFQVPQRAVLAPLLGQFHGSLLQVPGMFLKLAFEALEQREGVCRRTRKTGNHLVVVEPARFPGGVFQDVIAHGDLAIGNKHHFVVFAHAQYRRPVPLWLTG